MFLVPEIQIAAVSAGAAIVIGSAVALLGHRTVLGLALRAARLMMRRRMVSSLVLGSLASGGLAVASATGLEPSAAGDAFSFFQDNLTDALRAMGG